MRNCVCLGVYSSPVVANQSVPRLGPGFIFNTDSRRRFSFAFASCLVISRFITIVSIFQLNQPVDLVPAGSLSCL